MGPAIIGTLGREQKAGGLDAAALANALIAQKQQVADAIPADFAKMLAGTGLLDTVQGKTDTTAKAMPATPTRTVGTVSPAPAAATRGSAAAATAIPAAHHHHHFAWWPWLLAIAAACGLWWSVFGEKVMQDHPITAIPANVPPSTTLATTPVALPPVIANTEVGKQIVNVVDEMKGAIGGVRDAATAQTALPRLQDIAGRLDKVSASAARLNPDARRALATYVTSQQGLVKTSIGSVLALPGVSTILKSVLDQLQGRIDGLAKA